MFRYFTHANTRRYLDVLDDLLHSYDKKHHRSIGMAPSEENADIEDVVRARLYALKPKRYRWKHAAGDRVRIAVQRQPFRKGYLGDWSEEIFEIATRLPTVPVTYELRDLLGESIKGRFYEPEIQRVLKSDDERFVVDRILKTRKRDGKIQYLVSWKGWISQQVRLVRGRTGDDMSRFYVTLPSNSSMDCYPEKQRYTIHDESERCDRTRLGSGSDGDILSLRR